MENQTRYPLNVENQGNLTENERKLLLIWQSQGFDKASLIQEKAYLPIRQGENIQGISPTGTGKTLAYLLPLLANTEANHYLQLVIVAPTQELAGQIQTVVKVWSKPLNLHSQLLVGGANLKRQIDQLKHKPEIIVGTLGRLNELADKKKIKLNQVKAFVLDEADQLGGEERLSLVKAFYDRLPRSCQTLAFQATVQEREKLSQVMDLTEVIDVRNQVGPNQNRKYTYIKMPVRKRIDGLRRLAHLEGMQALVFVRAKADIEKIKAQLTYHGIPCEGLHSDLSSQKRQQIMQAFHQGKLIYLLTTDVTSRGIDIPHLPYVIEYDLATDQESYIHRAGRTARMGKSGTIISLVNNDHVIRELKHLLPKDQPLVEYFLYEGELRDCPPEKTFDKTKATLKKKKEKKNKARPNVLLGKEKPHKKKNRKRQQKNKGAGRFKK